MSKPKTFEPVFGATVELVAKGQGMTAPGMLLQYPTPRLPLTSISRMRSPVNQ